MINMKAVLLGLAEELKSQRYMVVYAGIIASKTFKFDEIENTLILRYPPCYLFHVMKLGMPENTLVVERILEDITGKEIKVTFEVDERLENIEIKEILPEKPVEPEEKVLIEINKKPKKKSKRKKKTISDEITSANKSRKTLINKLNKISYDAYLKTEHWLHFREETLIFNQNKCQVCNKKNDLNVHHKTYKNRGCETFNDVIVLCKECHSKYHDKF